MRKTLLASLLTLTLAACQPAETPKDTSAPAPAPAAEPATTPPPPPAGNPSDAFAAKLDQMIAGAHRSDGNKARDAYRHPKETLGFFGLGPGQTVVEITPGGGWYTEILAPTLMNDGRYVAAVIDPASVASEGAKAYYTKNNQAFRDKLAAHPELYGQAEIVEISMASPSFGADNSADLVVTFRNVHNWVGQDATQPMFDGFFKVLKPGGVLGVVEHRAKADETRELKEVAKTGYFPESAVIEMATKAGFQLADKSEINANPNDTKDHPNGVWTLPPSLNMKDVAEADQAKYPAIGESDRMTLKFVKPAG
ncbi:MAG: class I SAM-dependent methyltransferase [Rhodanobacteraceae bacterium]|nr:class I SAM-dependent methyltransferase [Rhodanobacteraceae bacterium]